MQIEIIFTYQTPGGIQAEFRSQLMNVTHAIATAEDLEKTGRSIRVTFLDADGNEWTLKELKKLTEEIQSEPHHITVYFDGGYYPETQKSGLGCVIYFQQDRKSFRLRKNLLLEGLESNNEAEYAALYLGLQQLEQMNVHHLPIKIVGDSRVVVNQMNDEWPCYEENLLRWMERSERIIAALGLRPQYQLVSRKENQEADHLATQALNGVEIDATKEIARR